MYNRALDDLFGGGRDWIGKTVDDMFRRNTRASTHERDRALLERPSSTTYEMLVPTAGGDTRQMLYNKVSFVDQHGEVAGLIGVITDVTRYKETERALEASEARFRVLTESSLDLISVIDAEGRILYQSPALQAPAGLRAGRDRRAATWSSSCTATTSSIVRAAFRRMIETRHSAEPVEFRLRHRDGMWRTFESLGTNCLANPHIRGVVFNSRDVTDRKVIQQRIQHLAYHDNLTGLPNRSLLQDRLAHSIARAERSNKKVAVLFIDLDNFKNINDTLGPRRGRRAAAPGVAAPLGVRAPRGHDRAPGRRRVHRAARQPRRQPRRLGRGAEDPQLAAPAVRARRHRAARVAARSASRSTPRTGATRRRS